MGDTAFNGANDGTYDQQLVSVGGSSVGENSYQINGLNITNFRNGVGSTWVPFEFVDEVQVKTGGYEAEFGRSTGGVVNMVTARGATSCTPPPLFAHPKACRARAEHRARPKDRELSLSKATSPSAGRS
jgi:hypothetical protein